MITLEYSTFRSSTELSYRSNIYAGGHIMFKYENVW